MIGSELPDEDGSEGIEGMLNGGPLPDLSDKWSSAPIEWNCRYPLNTTSTLVRWVMNHAGAGGESVDDGKMNTRDFDLY